MNGFKIRPLEAGDEERWRRMWRAYLEFYKTEKPEEVYATTFERLLDPGEPMHGLVAVGSDERPFGLTHYIFHRSCWTVSDYCYLQDLYLDPDRRGSGAAKALIDAVYRAADEQGCGTVYWLTQEFNYRGRALYDRVANKTPFIKYQK